MAKILFAQNTYFEILSFAHISAVIKKGGHQSDVIIFYRLAALLEKIDAFKPDIVAFSCITGDHDYVSKVTAAIKKHAPWIIVLVGGPHTTYFPEYITGNNVDVVCIGEGEYPTLDLMNAIDGKKDYSGIPNLWVRRKDGSIAKNDIRPLNDLAQLPFMDRTLYSNYGAIYNSRTKMFLFGRGCKENCTFCFTPRQKEIYRGKGKYIRFVDIDQLIAEIRQMKERYPGMQTVRMMDDSFSVIKERLLEFLAKFEPLGLSLVASVCLNEIDERVAAALGKAGCKLVYVGIESGNEELRNQVLKKRLPEKQMRDNIAALRKHNVQILSGNILAFPGDTIATALETIKVNIDLEIEYPVFAFFTPYPGTKLTEMALHAGLIDAGAYQTSIKLFYDKLILKVPNEKEFYNLYYIAPAIVRMPILFPLLPRLIRWPRNVFFTLLGLMFIYIDALKREGFRDRKSVV